MVAICSDKTGEYVEKVFGLALVTDGEYEHIRATTECESCHRMFGNNDWKEAVLSNPRLSLASS